MRRHFRKYLASSFAEESLVFWEYAEDFRRGHPRSRHPLAASPSCPESLDEGDADEKGDEKSEEDSISDMECADLKKWAKYIYDAFIADGAPMQVAIPGEEKVNIEKALEKDTPSAEAFQHTQSQLFNHLKFHVFPSFVQCSGYKKLLQSVVLHTMDTVSCIDNAIPN